MPQTLFISCRTVTDHSPFAGLLLRLGYTDRLCLVLYLLHVRASIAQGGSEDDSVPHEWSLFVASLPADPPLLLSFAESDLAAFEDDRVYGSFATCELVCV